MPKSEFTPIGFATLVLQQISDLRSQYELISDKSSPQAKLLVKKMVLIEETYRITCGEENNSTKD